MSETHYYVRVRGRITGPHTMADLKGMAGVGTLARFHEVSADRVNWQPAQSMAEVFAPAPPAMGAANVDTAAPLPRIAGEYEVKLADDASRPGGRTAPAPADAGGAAIDAAGPSLEGDGVALDAALAAMAGDASQMPGLSDAWARPSSSSDRLARAVASCAAGLLAISALMPHDRVAGGLVWTMGLLTQSTWPAALLAILALMAAVAAAPIAWLLSGPPRGHGLTAIGAAGLLALIALGAATSGAGVWIGVLLATPGACAAAVALLPPRPSHRPGTLAHRAALIMGPVTLGAGLAVCCIAAWLLGTVRDAQGRAPDWLIGAGAVGVLAGGAAIACGAISLAHTTNPRAGRAPLAAPVLAIAAAVLAILAVALTAYGAAGAADPLAQWRFIPLQFLRLILAALAFSAVLLVGLLETVSAADHGRSAATVSEG